MKAVLAGVIAAAIAGSAHADGASVCDGKYAEAASIIDMAYDRYGTVYSGGNHFTRIDTVIESVHLYRYLAGLPALVDSEASPNGRDALRVDGYAGLPVHEEGYQRGEWTAEDVRSNLAIMTADDPGLETKEILYAAARLDLMTSVGPAQDWWLDSGAYELSSMQAAVAEVAGESDALDWLQTALELSARPEATLTAMRPDRSVEAKRLHKHIAAKAQAADTRDRWLPLLLISADEDVALEGEMDAAVKDIDTAIGTCEAAPLSYASYMAGAQGTQTDAMPAMRQQLLRMREARRLTLDSMQRDASYGLDRRYFKRIEKLAQEAGRPDMFALPLMMSAPDMGTAKRVTQDYGMTSAALLLPASELEALDPGVALARYVALGRVDEAKPAMAAYVKRKPDMAEYAEGLSKLPDMAALSLFVLRTPCLSTRRTYLCDDQYDYHVHRDMHPSDAWAGRVASDFRDWMYAAPVHVRRRYYERGRTLKRHKYDWRDDEPAPPYVLPDLNQARFGARNGLATYAAWDEIGPLTHDKRLSRTLSLSIIDWVEAGTDTGWKRWRNPHKAEMAEALALVVRMAKHEAPGDYEAEPAQKRAFELLHYRFPKSDEAANTPYWWDTAYTH